MAIFAILIALLIRHPATATTDPCAGKVGVVLAQCREGQQHPGPCAGLTGIPLAQCWEAHRVPGVKP